MTAPNAGMDLPAEPMTSAEVAAIIGACSAKARTGIRNRALLTLLYRSGLRISEALALRPSDVDLKHHTLRLLDTKSGKAQTRGFHPSADDALARWMDTRKEMGIRAGRCTCPARIEGEPRRQSHDCRAHLFCTLDGGPVHAQYVRNMLGRLAARAGVSKRVHPHGFRHTFAAELEQAGTPVTVISKLLGHSGIAVTARYLDHLTNHQAVSALEVVQLPELADPA